MVDLLIILGVVLAVVVVVSAPLRRPAGDGDEMTAAAGDLADLAAAKEAKYGEIRDAELDYRTGKLSEPDWQAIDRGLRAEAIELLRREDAVRGRIAAAGAVAEGEGAATTAGSG